MKEVSELELLAVVRTLWALERNYMAEERTALAQFRTGLTLALIGPPASVVIAYVFSIFRLGVLLPLEIFTYSFLGIITLIGVWMSYRSNDTLKKITKKKKRLKAHQVSIIKNPKSVYNLLEDLLEL